MCVRVCVVLCLWLRSALRELLRCTMGNLTIFCNNNVFLTSMYIYSILVLKNKEQIKLSSYSLQMLT